MLIFYKLGGKETLKSNYLRNNLRRLFQMLLEGDRQTACLHKACFFRKPRWRLKVSKQLDLWQNSSLVWKGVRPGEFLYIKRFGKTQSSTNSSYTWNWDTWPLMCCIQNEKRIYLFVTPGYLDLWDRQSFSRCFPSRSNKEKKADRYERMCPLPYR